MEYAWRPATGDDVPAIVNMAESHFQTEIDAIFKPEPTVYARNLTLAIVNQFFLPTTEAVGVCYDTNTKLLSYTWIRTERAPWSDDNMALVRMAHVDLTLSERLRYRLVKDMMAIWERFAVSAGISIICSTTMRREQEGFLKLHTKMGYDVRGSYAYKRLNLESNLVAKGAWQWREHDPEHSC